METFLGSMVTICVVAAVMGLFTKSKQDKKTSSIYKFTVRASSAIIFIAVVTMAIPEALLVANFLQGDRTVSVYVCGGIFFALGLFLLIQTIPGANDILVDRDDITVRLAWFYKRHWSFSQIDYATADHNGLHVFVKGRKRRAFAAMAPLSIGTARDCWRGGPRCHPALALPTIFGAHAPEATQAWHCQRFLARLVSLGTVRGAPALQVAWNLPRATVFAATRAKGDAFGPDSVSLGVSRGTYSSSSSPLLPSFSLPARLSASRKIHSTCAFALRMSSSAQRSTAAQIFGSMRRGYCLRRATNVCSCEC